MRAEIAAGLVRGEWQRSEGSRAKERTGAALDRKCVVIKTLSLLPGTVSTSKTSVPSPEEALSLTYTGNVADEEAAAAHFPSITVLMLIKTTLQNALLCTYSPWQRFRTSLASARNREAATTQKTQFTHLSCCLLSEINTYLPNCCNFLGFQEYDSYDQVLKDSRRGPTVQGLE
jgi:hypothetical protein